MEEFAANALSSSAKFAESGKLVARCVGWLDGPVPFIIQFCVMIVDAVTTLLFIIEVLSDKCVRAGDPSGSESTAGLIFMAWICTLVAFALKTRLFLKHKGSFLDASREEQASTTCSLARIEVVIGLTGDIFGASVTAVWIMGGRFSTLGFFSYVASVLSVTLEVGYQMQNDCFGAYPSWRDKKGMGKERAKRCVCGFATSGCMFYTIAIIMIVQALNVSTYQIVLLQPVWLNFTIDASTNVSLRADASARTIHLAHNAPALLVADTNAGTFHLERCFGCYLVACWLASETPYAAAPTQCPSSGEVDAVAYVVFQASMASDNSFNFYYKNLAPYAPAHAAVSCTVRSTAKDDKMMAGASDLFGVDTWRVGDTRALRWPTAAACVDARLELRLVAGHTSCAGYSPGVDDVGAGGSLLLAALSGALVAVVLIAMCVAPACACDRRKRRQRAVIERLRRRHGHVPAHVKDPDAVAAPAANADAADDADASGAPDLPPLTVTTVIDSSAIGSANGGGGGTGDEQSPRVRRGAVSPRRRDASTAAAALNDPGDRRSRLLRMDKAAAWATTVDAAQVTEAAMAALETADNDTAASATAAAAAVAAPPPLPPASSHGGVGFCSMCGTAYADGAQRFCSDCGAPRPK